MTNTTVIPMTVSSMPASSSSAIASSRSRRAPAGAPAVSGVCALSPQALIGETRECFAVHEAAAPFSVPLGGRPRGDHVVLAAAVVDQRANVVVRAAQHREEAA